MSFFSQKSIWIIFFATAIFAYIFVITLSQMTVAQIDELQIMSEFSEYSLRAPSIRIKPQPIKVKGLYLTAYSAGSSKKIDEIINFLDRTELNSIVIDIKDYSGYVLYDSNLKFVNDNKLKDVRIKNLRALIAKLKTHNIYTIARISTFQDPILAETKPEWAIKSKSNPEQLWRDKNNLAWVNAARPEIWSYTVSVAQEASKAGFDEINLDYIRFPTDGNMKDILYELNGRKRYEVMGDFFKYFSEAMKDELVYISADLFGLTTEKGGEDDMMIGQRLSDAVKYFDYVCPMVYPSHYPSGYLDFSNPADHPYEVVFNAMRAGQKQAVGQRGKLRAWVQAFNMGAIYDGDKIRAQIDAVDKSGADGWILWNARNVYSGEGIEINS
ncbi:MAG: putative glycoside hydrolase [Candidatus Magasanikbacteria bacterium]